MHDPIPSSVTSLCQQYPPSASTRTYRCSNPASSATGRQRHSKFFSAIHIHYSSLPFLASQCSHCSILASSTTVPPLHPMELAWVAHHCMISGTSWASSPGRFPISCCWHTNHHSHPQHVSSASPYLPMSNLSLTKTYRHLPIPVCQSPAPLGPQGCDVHAVWISCSRPWTWLSRFQNHPVLPAGNLHLQLGLLHLALHQPAYPSQHSDWCRIQSVLASCGWCRLQSKLVGLIQVSVIAQFGIWNALRNQFSLKNDTCCLFLDLRACQLATGQVPGYSEAWSSHCHAWDGLPLWAAVHSSCLGHHRGSLSCRYIQYRKAGMRWSYTPQNTGVLPSMTAGVPSWSGSSPQRGVFPPPLFSLNSPSSVYGIASAVKEGKTASRVEKCTGQLEVPRKLSQLPLCLLIFCFWSCSV